MCPEFPKSLMIEAVKCVELAEKKNVSSESGDEILFEKFEIN